MWGQKSLSNKMNEVGRLLLSQDNEKDAKADNQAKENELESVGVGETPTLALAALKKKRVKKPQQGGGPAKDEPEGPVNEELKALEAHVLKLSKQGEIF